MPRTLKLLLLASALAAPPLCATPTAARALRQDAAARQASSADEELERARRMIAQGEAAAAASSLKPLAERRKTDADAWYYLGLALARADKPKDARKAFERALKLRPDSARAHGGLAYALVLLDKPGDAAREAAAALASDAQQAEAHYVVAALRFRESRYREAVAEAWAAQRADPEFSAAVRLAGEALLSAYNEESMRQARLYPFSPDAGKDEIRLVLEKRAPALAPFREGMRDLAGRLEALAAAHPNAPEAAALREQADTLRISGLRPGERGPGDIYASYQVTTKAVITYKPEPSYTAKARGHGVSGAVRLRAVLGSDGTVRNISVVYGLPDGLTEKAVEAARKIRFNPATVDGRPVSQYVLLEYNFAVY